MNAPRRPVNDPRPEADRTHTKRGPLDLPPESTAALARSLREVVAAQTGLHVRVGVEQITLGNGDRLPRFVVTLPAGATDAQRAEADYWINEMSPMYRYAGGGNPYGGRRRRRPVQP